MALYCETIKSQAAQCQVQFDQTEKLVPPNSETLPLCHRLFPFVSFNVLICASVYVKRKKGEGFVSVQKLSVIHVSSALICELCTAPG